MPVVPTATLPAGTRTIVVFGVALLVLYAATAQRGVSWQDSGVFQWRALTGDYAGVEGVARSHPLYIGAGRLLYALLGPAATPFALTLLSGVGMATAAALVACVVLRATGQSAPALLAGALLGLAHMPWWMATVAEVYTWSLAGLMAEVLLALALLRSPRVATGALLLLVNGLGLSVHNFALLALPVDAVLLLWLARRGDLPPVALVAAAGGWLLGAAPFLARVIVAAGDEGWVSAVRGALFGHIYLPQVVGVVPGQGWHATMANAALFGLSLGSPLWLAALAGWRRAAAEPNHMPAFRAWLAVLTAVHGLFFVRYFVPDQALFCLPTLGLLAVWCGLGLADVRRRIRRPARFALVCALLLVACAWLTPVTALAAIRSRGLLPPRARTLPFRDEARYWVLPWKHDETSAARFASAVRDQSRPGDIVYADSGAAGPLLVAARLHPDAEGPELISYYDRWTDDPAAMEAFLQGKPGRPLYVVSPHPSYLPAGLRNAPRSFEPAGVLHRLVAVASDRPDRHPGVTDNPPCTN